MAKIRVLSVEYKILMKHLKNHDGLCDPINRIIYLDKSLRDMNHLKLTLLHEIIHAWTFESGFSELLEDHSVELLGAGLSIYLDDILNYDFSKKLDAKRLKK